ncbi:MAG: alpha/beta hydrolase, partial [Pirellulaceae bacterium]
AEVSYHLYIPLAYDQAELERFPVLYWLHGTEGGVNHIRPVARMFHFAIRDKGVPPMMVVFVNGLSKRLWTDSKDGLAPVETVFIEELIPQVDKLYRTIPRREGRILEGFSMGGYGAARIG